VLYIHRTGVLLAANNEDIQKQDANRLTSTGVACRPSHWPQERLSLRVNICVKTYTLCRSAWIVLFEHALASRAPSDKALAHDRNIVLITGIPQANAFVEFAAVFAAAFLIAILAGTI
jgi:hypothetical protein